MELVKRDEVKIALSRFVGNNFDFEKVNGAIEKLAMVENLSTDDKKQAVLAIEEWEKITTKRIDSKKEELQTVVNLINSTQVEAWQFESKKEKLGKLAIIAGAEATFKKIEDAVNKIIEKKEDQPEKYVFDDEFSRNENLLKQQESEKEIVVFEIEMRKLEKEYLRLTKELMKIIKKNASIKESTLAAEKFILDASKLSRICRDKSALAKINVLVSNKELKESLREMMNFSMENEAF